MPDLLTPNEIEAIRAFPQHRIRVIPLGTRALGYDPMSMREQIRVSATSDIRARERRQAVARIERQPGETEDGLIARAWGQGLTLRAIGILIGKSHIWAYKRLRDMDVSTARRNHGERKF